MNAHLVSVALSVCLAAFAPLFAGAQDQTNAEARGGPFPRQIAVFDRQGSVVRTLGDPGNYALPILAPDATRLAVVKRDPGQRAHIWVFDVSTGVGRQITFHPAGESAPTWSPDGSQIAFSSRRNNRTGLYRVASDGTAAEEMLYQHTLAAQAILTDWSPDGRFLSFHSGGVLYVLPLAGNREPIELIRDEYEAYAGRLSPDSRFIAYASDESGRNEVYVQAFDVTSARLSTAAGKWQVSRKREPLRREDGSLLPESCYEDGICVEPPQWRQDATELLYIAEDGAVMAAEITITPTFQATAPKLLFRVPGAGRLTSPDAYYSSASIARDGQQFAFAVAMAPARNIVLVALETLATYVGRYVAAGDGEELVVTLEDDQLTLQLQERKLRLFAESETYFFGREFPIGDFDIEFVKDGAGAVTAVLTYFGGPGSRWVRQ